MIETTGIIPGMMEITAAVIWITETAAGMMKKKTEKDGSKNNKNNLMYWHQVILFGSFEHSL